MSAAGLQVVIEGQSGAGKTPLIEELRKALARRGLACEVCAPFALANNLVLAERADCPLGVYNLWSISADTAIYAYRLLSGYICEHAENCARSGSVALFDRGWLTIAMGLLESALPAADIQFLVEDLIRAPAATFFLDTKPEITQSRASWRAHIPWTNQNILSDFDMRREFIGRCPSLLDRHLVSEARIDLTALAERWADKIAETASR